MSLLDDKFTSALYHFYLPMCPVGSPEHEIPKACAGLFYLYILTSADGMRKDTQMMAEHGKDDGAEPLFSEQEG